jgi:hypothetical protein
MIARCFCFAVFSSLVAIAGCAAHDDTVHSNAPASPPPAASSVEIVSTKLVDDAAQRCFEAAKLCARGALNKDAAAIVNCMPDNVVDAVGGRQVTMATIAKIFADVDAAGGTVDDVRISPPTAIARGAGHAYAIVPETLTMAMPQGRGVQRSYLLGVSGDDGRSWRLVDGVKLTRVLVVKFFPDFPATLELPVVAAPMMIKQ